MLLYGESFCGKSTFASQAVYLKNEDGSPMKILYIDAESGSIDNYLDEMENNNVNLDNLYLVYTQSLGEVLDCIKKVKDNEDFYEIDNETGEETDIVVTDSEGKPFRADMIIVDGVTVLHTAAQQGLLEFSKKRARVRADNKGLVGDEKLISIEGSSLETRDWGAISYKGASLCLSLLGTGKHSIVTCREKAETVTEKNNKGETVEVSDITRLKNSQKETDELINTLCLIASELYNIVEAFIPVTMELRDEPTRTESPFVMLYYTLVKRGLKDIEEVPYKFKEEVKELLK